MKRLHGSYGAANLSLAEAKARLRREMRELRRRVARANPNAAVSAASHFVTWSAGVSPALRQGVIASYVAQGGELDPTPATLTLAGEGWVVAFPRATTREGVLTFRATGLPSTHDAFGILAPPEEAALLTPDLIIVPVLAFDRHGGRLGQGAGCYDRTIAALRASSVLSIIGLAYAQQEVPRVPTEDYDQRLDGILTDTGFIEVLNPPL